MVEPNILAVRRSIIVAIAVATVVTLLTPTPAAAQRQGGIRRAADLCEQAGGTFTTLGSGEIFACTFPLSVNVNDILNTPILLRRLPHACFAAGGSSFGPVFAENAVVCFE